MRDKISSSDAIWRVEELSAAAFPAKVLAPQLRLSPDAISGAWQVTPGCRRRLGCYEAGLPLV